MSESAFQAESLEYLTDIFSLFPRMRVSRNSHSALKTKGQNKYKPLYDLILDFSESVSHKSLKSV